MAYINDLIGSRELLINLTMREVKGKYKRTVFGQLWSLANPLALMLIYTFVFSFIFRVEPDVGDPSGLDVFPIWLLCGLLPWLFFSNVAYAGSASLVANAGLIQKVYFARSVLPLAQVASAGYNWLFEMGVLVVAILIVGGFVLPWIPLVVVFMALLAVFAAGVAMMLSIANVYFRDTEHLLGIVLQIWMYLTPIIYPISLVAEQSEMVGGLAGTDITLLELYRLNPMERFIEIFRNLLYDNTWPDFSTVIYCTLWAFGTLALGLWLFQRNEKGLAEAL